MLTDLMQFRLTIKFIRECKKYSADALSKIFEDISDEQKKTIFASARFTRIYSRS